MQNHIHIQTIRELFPDTMQSSSIREKINYTELDSQQINRQFVTPVFLNASIIIFVLSGTGTIRINYKNHTVRENTVILLSASHLFNFDKCSPEFKCTCLLVSKAFMEEMDSTDMIYRRIKYGVKLYHAPVLQLQPENISLLLERVAMLNKAIDNTGHLYHKEMILNHLFAFYLDMSNIIDCRPNFNSNSTLTRYESTIHTFIELLVSHYRNEHKVEFYSARLNISAHYLTLLVKRHTGQSVSDLIFEMLYSEARNLLTHSKLSIQEITGMLHFSDQSSFGKFFKRRAGLSPIDYRKAQK